MINQKDFFTFFPKIKFGPCHGTTCHGIQSRMALSRSKFLFHILIGIFFTKISSGSVRSTTVSFSPFNGPLYYALHCLLHYLRGGGGFSKRKRNNTFLPKNLFWISVGIYCRILSRALFLVFHISGNGRGLKLHKFK